MFGWHGRILFIDLGKQSFHSKTISHDRLQTVIGGRGLAVSLFQDYARLDPFAPDIPLIMTTGPLAGTATPATERLCILSRSPLTGTIFDTSAGGSFAHALKASGHDGLFITGASSRPLAIHIKPCGVEFIPADALWGETTSTVIAAFAERGVAAIGPAGENGVLYANIVFSDGDNTGRGGLGAVMGRKNLKAIAVDGDRQTKVADQTLLGQAQQDIMRLLRASPAIFGQYGLHEYGTPTFVDLTNQRNMLPSHNFQATNFRYAANISGPAIRKQQLPQHDRCYDCPIACKKTDASNNRLPEYSTIGHFGPLLNNDNLQSITAANNVCRELGLDPVSTASTLACRSEISGDFPEPVEFPGIITRFARQQGNDSLLALGSKRLAANLGKPEISMTVKGLELPAFDPRGAIGMALSFCTSTLGGSETHANLQACEILRKPVAVDRLSFTGKARLLKLAEDAHAAYDSLITCHHPFYAASLEEYCAALCAVTGIEYSPAGLCQSGAAIVLTERKINRQNRFSSADDILPERFFNTAGSAGNGLAIPAVEKQAFTDELRRYARIRDNIADDRSPTAGPLT